MLSLGFLDSPQMMSLALDFTFSPHLVWQYLHQASLNTYHQNNQNLMRDQ